MCITRKLIEIMTCVTTCNILGLILQYIPDIMDITWYMLFTFIYFYIYYDIFIWLTYICRDIICVCLLLSYILTIPFAYSYFSVPIFPMCIKGNVGHSEEWVYSLYGLIYSESIKEIVLTTYSIRYICGYVSM